MEVAQESIHLERGGVNIFATDSHSRGVNLVVDLGASDRVDRLPLTSELHGVTSTDGEDELGSRSPVAPKVGARDDDREDTARGCDTVERERAVRKLEPLRQGLSTLEPGIIKQALATLGTLERVAVPAKGEGPAGRHSDALVVSHDLDTSELAGRGILELRREGHADLRCGRVRDDQVDDRAGRAVPVVGVQSKVVLTDVLGRRVSREGGDRRRKVEP